MSKTFSHLVNFNVQSLALNKDGNRLIAAGTSDWELFTIEEDRFVSNFILNPRLVNHRIVDIGWSRLDQRLVASCGSNGVVQKLIVTQSELKLENTYRFHDLTVSKLHFHPTEPNLLISGGQDGNIKLIDFRVPLLNGEVLSTFKHSHEDKVTDLQFNPHLSNQFASGSESGVIYMWDKRKYTEPEKRYKLSRNISHIEWHPEEKNWLAVSGVDRLISVLDVSLFMTLERPHYRFSLTNPESVSNIRWRPNRKTQIGACMSGSNFHLKYLYVWDLTRPYVPYASFDSVINKANNFLWRSTDSIIASAKAELVNGNVQSTIYNAVMCDTLKPADYMTVVSVEMDRNGSLAFAKGFENEQKNEALEADMSSLLSYYPNSDKFQINRSELLFLDDPIITKTDWFRHSATNYRFINGSFEELCDHNAQVALDFKRVDDYKNWMILKTMYKESDKFDFKEEDSSKSNSSLGNSKQLQSGNKINSNENNSTIQIPISQVTAIANVSSSPNDSDVETGSSGEIASGDSPVIESNGNPLLVNLDPNNNSNNQKLKEVSDKLTNFHPTDSFFASTNNELDNHEIQENNNLLNNSYLTKFEDDDEYSIHTKENGDFQNLGDLIGFLSKNEREAEFLDNDDQHLSTYPSNFKSQSDLTMSIAQSTKLLENKDQKTSINVNNTNSNLEINKIADLNTQFQSNIEIENALKINFDERFCELLFSYVNEKNDLVTAIFMYLIATQHNKIDKTKIDSLYLDEWFIQYIDLLAKYELWNQRIEILKNCQTEFLRNQAQKAHSYTTMCASCRITIKPGTQICRECKKNAFLCSYCHLPVKRLYAWCHFCCHGGHLIHMMKWFKTNKKCPTGCGCACSPNYS